MSNTFNRTLFDRIPEFDHVPCSCSSYIKGNCDDDEKGIATDIRLALAHFDGTSVTGSPSARRYPATALFPYTSAYEPCRAPSMGSEDFGAANHHFEFEVFSRLLRSSSKQPMKFEALGHAFHTSGHSGIPPEVFDLEHTPEAVSLLNFPNIPRVLRLRVADGLYGPYTGTFESMPALDTLMEFLPNAPVLEELSLIFPSRQVYRNAWLYDYTQVFPSVVQWRHSKPRTLHLYNLSFSYKNLAGLLFLALPVLSDLRLATILLTNGAWAGIVEGLRQQDSLKTFCFMEDLCYTDGDSEISVAANEYDESYDDPTRQRVIDKHLAALSTYVMKGGRHPYLGGDEPDSAAARYMAPLNQTLDNLRKLSVD
ncbi:MAG: hypothetical protein Q9186_006734 [Xanthomendoza sp. 1 TL-2023]